MMSDILTIFLWCYCKLRWPCDDIPFLSERVKEIYQYCHCVFEVKIIASDVQHSTLGTHWLNRYCVHDKSVLRFLVLGGRIRAFPKSLRVTIENKEPWSFPDPFNLKKWITRRNKVESGPKLTQIFVLIPWRFLFVLLRIILSHE